VILIYFPEVIHYVELNRTIYRVAQKMSHQSKCNFSTIEKFFKRNFRIFRAEFSTVL